MRRLITTLALGLCLLGCGSESPVGGPVQLLTGVDSCYAGGEQGTAALLVPDPVYGTTFNGQPVMWPVGFTGVGFEGRVEVLDPARNIVAMTGRRYYISEGYVGSEEKKQLKERIRAYAAAANCPYPWDFVDCAAPPTGPPGVAEVKCGGAWVRG